MDFNGAISIIANALLATGTSINTNEYDGIIVKKLSASNTLDEGRTTNQTHIAITGPQMDMFPYIRSEGYLSDDDPIMKKYFVLQIPVKLFKTNIDYICGVGNYDIEFDEGVCKTRTSIVRNKRASQSDQIQVSLLDVDGKDFIALRRMLITGSYLILLKERKSFSYQAFGLKSVDGVSLDSLNNAFYKQATNTLVSAEPEEVNAIDETVRLSTGENVLLYGVPGSGKSWTIEHEYCQDDCIVERLVFHPDYTNADFVGQILPVVDEEKQVTYEFTAGPFTTIMREAYKHPKKKYILIIEEINRGNAPAIFGEIFQLLDRTVKPKTDGGVTYSTGTSEYGVTHKYMAEFIYGDAKHKVRIPSNLSILGTMNTSDQNVFTLDTAFQRRWRMRLIENNFDTVRDSLAKAKILDTGVTWERFCSTINQIIIGNKAKMASAEDKRLGVYFIHETDVSYEVGANHSSGYSTLADEYNELLKAEREEDISEEQKSRLHEIRNAVMHNRLFPEKVIKYLWDDAFKFNPEALFDTENMDSLEKVIRTFVFMNEKADRFKVFKQGVRDLLTQ